MSAINLGQPTEEDRGKTELQRQVEKMASAALIEVIAREELELAKALLNLGMFNLEMMELASNAIRTNLPSDLTDGEREQLMANILLAYKRFEAFPPGFCQVAFNPFKEGSKEAELLR